MRRRGSDTGFSLVEALVALLIAAGALGGFYNAISTGAKLEQRAEQQANLTVIATQLMDQVGVDLPLRDGLRETGRTEAVTWDLAVTSNPQRDMELAAFEAGALLFVIVTVTSTAQDQTSLTLRSIRYRETPV